MANELLVIFPVAFITAHKKQIIPHANNALGLGLTDDNTVQNNLLLFLQAILKVRQCIVYMEAYMIISTRNIVTWNLKNWKLYT